LEWRGCEKDLRTGVHCYFFFFFVCFHLLYHFYSHETMEFQVYGLPLGLLLVRPHQVSTLPFQQFDLLIIFLSPVLVGIRLSLFKNFPPSLSSQADIWKRSHARIENHRSFPLSSTAPNKPGGTSIIGPVTLSFLPSFLPFPDPCYPPPVQAGHVSASFYLNEMYRPPPHLFPAVPLLDGNHRQASGIHFFPSSFPFSPLHHTN